MHLDDFNRSTATDLRPQLLACCDVPQWADTILAGRPYADRSALESTADAAARSLAPAQVEQALAAHPRIGERASGAATEASWSRGEQASVSRDQTTQEALREGNLAYEQRFGRVFLICASGRTGEEILAELHRRLDHDDATEEAVVADELRQIALLRLRKVLS